ncbi:MAG TPA: ester cyclase [Edaphobacter sp.]|nr:ester cyclase [Edaphobacter sp.]
MTFLEQWFEEVWNKGRIEAIDEMSCPDVITHGLEHADGTRVNGRAAFKVFHKQLRASFSNIHIDVMHTLSQGDITMAHCVVTGVHSGDGLGMPATGRRVSFTGMCLVRLEGGKAAEAWNNFDLASVYRQLAVTRRDQSSLKSHA